MNCLFLLSVPLLLSACNAFVQMISTECFNFKITAIIHRLVFFIHEFVYEIHQSRIQRFFFSLFRPFDGFDETKETENMSQLESVECVFCPMTNVEWHRDDLFLCRSSSIAYRSTAMAKKHVPSFESIERGSTCALALKIHHSQRAIEQTASAKKKTRDEKIVNGSRWKS